MNNNTLTLNPLLVFKKDLSLEKKFNLRQFCLVGTLLIIALSVFYVFQANTEASAKYLVWQYENQLNKVSKENQNLIIDSFEAKSLENISDFLEESSQLGKSNFEKIDKIHYIQLLDTQLVAK